MFNIILGIEQARGTTVNHDLENIITPIKVDVLERLLHESKYIEEETKFLVDGFRNGFDFCYRGPLKRKNTSHNLSFHVGNRTILWEKLIKEVKLGHVAGPFDAIPFDNYIQSPIGLVPKDKGLHTRLIFHLSYDFEDGSKSVNFHTPAELCTVTYRDLDMAVKLCIELSRQGAEVVYM